MGRIVQGNSASAQVTKLTRTLGAISASPQVADTTTTAVTSGAWGTFQTLTSTSAARVNTAADQSNSNYTVQQDPIQAYNLVQANVSGNGLRQVIFDDELNMVANYAAAMSNGSTLRAVRLYNGVLYRFGTSGAVITVDAVNLSTSAVTTYTTTLSHSITYTLVFNWQIGGKLHIVASTSTGASFVSFDLSTGEFATLKQWTGTGLSTLYAMHVNTAGTACSVATFDSNSGNYGVLLFPASGAASVSGYSTSGHATFNGSYTTFGSTATNIAITEACAVDTATTPQSGGPTYTKAAFHLAGGDSSVQTTAFNGPGNYVSPFDFAGVCSSRPNNTLIFGNLTGATAAITIGRSGNTLTLTAGIGAHNQQGSSVPCALPGLHVSINGAGSEGSAYMSAVGAASSVTGRSASWSFNSANVAGKNSNPYAQATSCRMAFVTRTGRFFYMGWYYSQAATTATFNAGWIPVFVAPRSTSYDIQVIGAGGGSHATTPVHGGSSTIAGISAAPGGSRLGGRAGSMVASSGPLVGTGGQGYGDDRYGQGEDATGAGSYGGGSGYMVPARISVQAGEAVPYVAGVAPQYGGQGAILMMEVL